MNSDQPVTWLMFFTLASAIIVAAGAFLYFLRSRSNRDAAENALAGKGSAPKVGTSGAAPELAGVFVILLVAMGLLTAGYTQRQSGTQTAGSTAIPQTVGSSSAAITDPNAPKPYQPANPAPDLRVAPTGTGADGKPETAK